MPLPPFVPSLSNWSCTSLSQQFTCQQTARYDVSRRNEYLATTRGVGDPSTVGRSAALGPNIDSPSSAKAAGLTSGNKGNISSGGNTNPYVNSEGRGPRGIVRGRMGEEDQEGGRDSGDVGRGCRGVDALPLQSLPLPFANLRERTFDMTKRGELTSANVWYAARRRRNEEETSARQKEETGKNGRRGGEDSSMTISLLPKGSNQIATEAQPDPAAAGVRGVAVERVARCLPRENEMMTTATVAEAARITGCSKDDAIVADGDFAEDALSRGRYDCPGGNSKM